MMTSDEELLGRVVRMTRKGRRAIKARKFPPGMSPMARLAAAIISMTDDRGVTAFNVQEIAGELLAHHGGDIAAAIDTVLAGRVRLEGIRPN
jgi:hypothetical protein